MSGIISESFINKWPRLGRAHLRLQNVFLGWAPKLPDSGTIMGSFHATLCIYFTAFLCLLSLQSHLENIFGSCRNRRTEIVELFYVQRLHVLRMRDPLPLLPPPSFSSSFFSVFCYTQIADERKAIIFREEFQIKNVKEMVELNQNITNKRKKLL